MSIGVVVNVGAMISYEALMRTKQLSARWVILWVDENTRCCDFVVLHARILAPGL